ncbi:MAG TPA: Xaa-Pro peptidase family protein [Candidatus Limnocylindrales bacterium]|nr:Xaa-Pro peptidase family protein [Candidatus Limnocylindrales bacterium]
MSDAAQAGIPPERYARRLADLGAIASERGLGAVLVGVGPDLVYLTGYRAMPLERLTMLVVPPSAAPVLVVPRLEQAAARAGLLADVRIAPWAEQEDPYRLALDAATAHGPLAVSDRLWASHLLALQALRPAASFVRASSVLRELRMRKDAEEVELLRAAAHAADRVVAAIAAGRLVGRTEADVAREVRERLVDEGHEVAEFAIVASGPNSASPHHEASERVIQAGEPIVLDIGGLRDGYGSDVTRTLWVTGGDPASGPDADFLRLFEAVREAQAEATSAVRPGLPAERVDAVARGIIGAAGYGEFFIHRVGHGIGLETHEEPYLVTGNAEPLVEGAAFSVEPGIYLEGRYGARIEDIVVCGPSGPIVLNEAPRDLYVVAG